MERYQQVELEAKTLVDPRFEHDSCGVGLVATLTALPSHQILTHSLTALARLAHRGAIAADGQSSDGVGIMTGIPRELLLAQTSVQLSASHPLAVGVIFYSATDDGAAIERELESAVSMEQFMTLAWRDVPVDPQALGEIARASMPRIRQLLLTTSNHEHIERRLYIARKRFERSAVDGYVCSLSSRVLVYKALCAGRLLPNFYPDLQDPRYTTAFAIFHQRYATNVMPAWERAQPLRMLAHNGEINTVWGNRARMDARASSIPLECHPLITPDGSDSTSLDEAIELIARNGRTLAEAIRMLLPPAPNAVRSAYMRYHSQTVEPWDGPAALAFSDGELVGAAMDRNGLRPCRYYVTEDGLVFAGSEAGLIDLDPKTIRRSERLGPGQMLLVDLAAHTFYDNEALNNIFDHATGYGELIEPGRLEPLHDINGPRDAQELVNVQRGFGYTREDVKMVLAPMAIDAKDAIWSMGDDTPIAPLSHTPRSVYAYFRQRFAQVTNPPIDPLREACVTSLSTRLGPWPHLLNKHAPLPGIELPSPFLSRGQVATLRAARHPNAEHLPLAVLDCLFPTSLTLEHALDDLCSRACDLVVGGAAILLLTDRGATHAALPIPMAMATGAVHSTLVNRGLRTQVGLAVEAGDCRDLHHAAVLIGYGAGAVCPWLALETAAHLNPVDGEERMQRALELGLAKVMAKMGISVVDSYRGAHLFDAIGLHDDVIHRCFFGTPSPLSGCTFADIETSIRSLWQPSSLSELPDPGWVRFRRHDGAEIHAWQPPTVKAVQQVAGTARGTAATDVLTAVSTEPNPSSPSNLSKRPAALRDLLDIRPAGPELDTASVEPPTNLMKRFIASAMSLGSLSPEAHHTITEAMNQIGARSNTGEGGEDPAVYRPTIPGGPLLLNNKIKQVASGRFGVTAEYLAQAEELEIKIAQGSKPGEGGQLPSHKVTELIARLRHAQPGIALISPPPHHDIYSIEDLAQLIYDLKRVNPRARIGVKLVSGLGIGTVAAGVAKAYADYIVIAGNSGGTGASPLSSIKYAGNPWELGLAEVQQVLMQNQLRGRVRLRVDGGLNNARDVLVAALLGAEEFAFGTSVLVALGCDMARQCHLNTCPTGIATQRPDLRAKFRGKPEHVIRFFESLARELQQLLARLGLPSLESAIGRTDLLEQVRRDGGLDLSSMLTDHFSGARQSEQNHNPRPESHPPIDDAWVAAALQAQREGRDCQISANIVNEDRSLGARLAGVLALQPDRDTSAAISIQCRGTSGQSFGAFAVTGMKLTLDGQANDFVGKGLSGGEIVIRPVGSAARNTSHHVILGNVALYGATAGSLFAAGRAGERFAVRNSGAHAVVEGVGDHGCEYMTGGSVVILGDAGTNFGAGMRKKQPAAARINFSETGIKPCRTFCAFHRSE